MAKIRSSTAKPRPRRSMRHILREVGLEDLRELRRRVNLLNASLVEDYLPFYDEQLNSFFRLPSKPLGPNDRVGVTLTATAIMALSQQGKLGQILSVEDKSAFHVTLED